MLTRPTIIMNMRCPWCLPRPGQYSDAQRNIVWPDENLIEIMLDDLVNLKVERDDAIGEHPDLYDITKIYKKRMGKNLIKIKGTPNLSNVQECCDRRAECRRS